MANLWTLGGLSWRELLTRTWRETWEDAVFGQAARLAFYHFLAIFPGLLLFGFLLVRFPSVDAAFRTTLIAAFREILPQASAALMQGMIEKLHATAEAGVGALAACLGAAWAAVNAAWAMMTGLNTAYEVKEERPLWKVIGTAFALAASLGFMFLVAVAVTAFGIRLAHEHAPSSLLLFRCVQWPVLIFLLLACFALYYRFGPNLYDREWQWSTPGAVLGLLLWLLATALIRLYFELFHTYHAVYGPVGRRGDASAVALFHFGGHSDRRRAELRDRKSR